MREGSREEEERGWITVVHRPPHSALIAVDWSRPVKYPRSAVIVDAEVHRVPRNITRKSNRQQESG